jgi:hypothetical protein
MDTQVGAGTSSKRGRLGNGRVIGMTVFALVAALIVSQIIMHRAPTGGEANATKHSTSLSNQDFIVQQRTLEESTSAAGTVPSYRTIDGMTYYDRHAAAGQNPAADVAQQYRQEMEAAAAAADLRSAGISMYAPVPANAVVAPITGAPYMEDFPPAVCLTDPSPCMVSFE